MSVATYKKKTSSKASLKKVREQRAEELKGLREALEEYELSSDPAALAAVLAQHDGYSPRNAMLIAMQQPTATDVAGFREWITRGRHVRKGEKGIRILAPAGKYTTTEEPADSDPLTKEWVRFKAISVFDVSQTDPSVPGVPAPAEEDELGLDL